MYSDDIPMISKINSSIEYASIRDDSMKELHIQSMLYFWIITEIV